MKSIKLLLFLCVIQYGCTKDIDTIASVDPVIYNGIWAGSIHYNIKGIVHQTLPATRTISFQNSEFTSVWWVAPSCKTFMRFTGNIYSIDALLTDSTICNGMKHHWTYKWSGTGELKGDTLTESGTTEYRYYVDNVLFTDSFGNWEGKFSRQENSDIYHTR
jgi:hypothetical protein